jgi:hypothetical protein
MKLKLRVSTSQLHVAKLTVFAGTRTSPGFESNSADENTRKI